MLSRLLVGITLGAGLLSAQTNLLQNGNFEVGPAIPGTQTEVTVTGNQIPGWFIPYGNVDFNSAFWTPSSGVHSIDLHGIVRGAIEQTAATEQGIAYEVVFDLGATEPRGCFVTAAGLTSPTFNASGPGHPRVAYSLDQRWSFVAAGPFTTIRFESTTGANAANGPHIDHVRLFRISSPASFRTFGTGCPGSAGTPSLDAMPGSRPLLGQEFTLEVHNLSASLADAVVLFLGLDAMTPPTSLDPLGMTSCELHIQPLDAVALLKFAGSSRWRVNIPSTPALLGAALSVQALGFDRNPAPNPFGATMSNAGEMILGTQ